MCQTTPAATLLAFEYCEFGFVWDFWQRVSGLEVCLRVQFTPAPALLARNIRLPKDRREHKPSFAV